MKRLENSFVYKASRRGDSKVPHMRLEAYPALAKHVSSPKETSGEIQKQFRFGKKKKIRIFCSNFQSAKT